MTKEELLNKKVHFTMKSLRRFVKENENLSEDDEEVILLIGMSIEVIIAVLIIL